MRIPVWLPVLLLSFYCTGTQAAGSDDALAACQSLYVRLTERARGLYDEYLGKKVRALEEKPLVQGLHQFLQDPHPRFPEPEPGGSPLLGSGARLVKGAGRAVGELLSPIPLPVADNKLEAIFTRLWKDARYKPSRAEVGLMKERGIYDFFLKRQKFLLDHPSLSRARELPALARKAFTVVGAATALNQAYEMGKNTTTFSDLLEGPMEDENGQPIVQMIVETTPFPHTSLRIGRKVYSYGVTFMTSRPLFEYLNAPPLEHSRLDAAEARNILPNLAAGASKSFAEGPGKRSLRVTTLHLPPEAVARLQRELEMNTGKVYENKTTVHDCATMIKRALESNSSLHIPWDIDAFPTVTSTYLSLRRTLGDRRIGETQLVLASRDDSKAWHLARNAYIATVESNLLFASLPLTALQRAYFEATTGESKRQYYLPEIQADIDGWKSEARGEAIGEIEEYLKEEKLFADLAKMTDPRARSEKLAAARKTLDLVSAGILEKAESSLSRPSAEMKDVIVAAEKKAAVEEARARLLRRLAGAASSSGK